MPVAEFGVASNSEFDRRLDRRKLVPQAAVLVISRDAGNTPGVAANSSACADERMSDGP
jgi:hypothetical protein